MARGWPKGEGEVAASAGGLAALHCLQHPSKREERRPRHKTQKSTSKPAGRGTWLNTADLWAAPGWKSLSWPLQSPLETLLLTQGNVAPFQAPLRLSNFKHLLMFVDSPGGSWPSRSPRQPRENPYENLQIITGAGRWEERRPKGGKVKAQTSR